MFFQNPLKSEENCNYGERSRSFHSSHSPTRLHCDLFTRSVFSKSCMLLMQSFDHWTNPPPDWPNACPPLLGGFLDGTKFLAKGIPLGGPQGTKRREPGPGPRDGFQMATPLQNWRQSCNDNENTVHSCPTTTSELRIEFSKVSLQSFPNPEVVLPLFLRAKAFSLRHRFK